MVDDEELHRAVLAFQQRDSMRPKRVADGTGTCGITPVLAGLRGGRHLGKGLLGWIKKHETGNSRACRAVHELADDDRLAIGGELEIFRRTGTANDVDIAVRAALHQSRLRRAA